MDGLVKRANRDPGWHVWLIFWGMRAIWCAQKILKPTLEYWQTLLNSAILWLEKMRYGSKKSVHGGPGSIQH